MTHIQYIQSKLQMSPHWVVSISHNNKHFSCFTYFTREVNDTFFSSKQKLDHNYAKTRREENLTSVPMQRRCRAKGMTPSMMSAPLLSQKMAAHLYGNSCSILLSQASKSSNNHGLSAIAQQLVLSPPQWPLKLVKMNALKELTLSKQF